MQVWQVIRIAGFLVIGIYAWSGSAQAQYYGGHIDQRQENQQCRIQNGIASGTLTPQEVKKLEHEQQRIQTAENRMRSRSGLDPKERVRLDRMLDKADRNIYREKNDRQAAYPGYRNHHQPHHRQWQDNHRRDQRYWNKEPQRMQRVAHRPNHREHGRFFRVSNRDRRQAWNH